MEQLKYQFWYYFYKVSNKVGLWKMYQGVDEETGIPYIMSYWLWQNKPQDVVVFGKEDEHS